MHLHITVGGDVMDNAKYVVIVVHTDCYDGYAIDCYVEDICDTLAKAKMTMMSLALQFRRTKINVMGMTPEYFDEDVSQSEMRYMYDNPGAETYMVEVAEFCPRKGS